MSTRDIDDDPWPMGHDEDDEMFARREARHQRHRSVPDFVRRAIENTMGSVQNTQNASREALQFFLSSTDKTRREIVRIVAGELGDFLKHVDISSEVIKVLTGVQADLQISIRFRRTEDGVKPEVTSKKEPLPKPAPPEEEL